MAIALPDVANTQALPNNHNAQSESPEPVANPAIQNDALRDDKLLDEAEAWVVKLRSDAVSADDKRAFSRWLNCSPAHQQAFDQALATWHMLGAVSHLPDVDQLLADPPRSARWHAPLIATAACFALALLGTLVWHGIPTDAPTAVQRYATGIGESRQISLEDGSTVTLNTHSALEVRYNQDQRSLTLVRGEAYFDVAKDAQRPFVVDFGRGTATAVGTAFNIYRQNSQAAVQVTEGIVDVREAADVAVPAPAPQRVLPNQEILVSLRGLGPVKRVDTASALAWRERTVVFRNTPLREAVAEINRYLVEPVDLDNSDLAYHSVSGTFQLDDPRATLDAIASAFALTRRDVPGGRALYLSLE